ncbi:MAG: hypothetical protein EHM60_05070 [Lysobacterales bacterium]|nr:MAG: hypothetical protein EHM60_05070 [Xanthomonadales bacterium]
MSGGREPRRRVRRPAVQVELDLPPGGTPVVEDARACDARWWQQPAFVAGLAIATAVLLALTLGARVASHRDRERATELEARLKSETLRPATQARALRIDPNPASWSAAPDATLRWPEPPELLEIYLPLRYADYTSYAIVVDKVDHGRVMVLERVARDSNGDLRFSINSSAFGPGEYRLRLQGYTWRGQRVDAGWVRLVVE